MMITRKRMFLYNFRHVNEKQKDKEIKKKKQQSEKSITYLTSSSRILPPQTSIKPTVGSPWGTVNIWHVHYILMVNFVC